MLANLLNFLSVAVGLYVGIRNVRLLMDEQALREYLRTSPKAANWVAKYGPDGAMRMARETLPLGIVVAVVLFAIGAWGLYKAMLPVA